MKKLTREQMSDSLRKKYDKLSDQEQRDLDSFIETEVNVIIEETYDDKLLRYGH